MRTVFQRDRDRVIHSAAFRRLEYKTQVFIPHEQDHFRTRLTHTIEVSQIARTMARAMRLNEDLAEAIALVHDLGHTPFGHSGEDVLNDLLADFGGFNHNRQSLRVVDVLETRYPEHPGLNLSFEIREGIVKHETSVKIVLPEFEGDASPTLEASLVDMADEIAYNAHDIDDGLSSGIISFDDVLHAEFWRTLANGTMQDLRGLAGDQRRYALSRHLVDVFVTDVLEETSRRLSRLNIGDLESVRSATEKMCDYSEPMVAVVTDLKMFLRTRLYKHPHLLAMSGRARETIEAVYERFMLFPDLLPLRFQEMMENEAKEIVIGDYIAGMTDRYAEKIRGQLSG